MTQCGTGVLLRANRRHWRRPAYNSANASYTVRFDVRAVFDQAKPAESGSTLPVKIQLLDAAGISSRAASVVATGVRAVGGSAVLPVQWPGNSNPGGAFAFDVSNGVYRFNLKTTGLAPGAYELLFSVAGQGGYAVRFTVG